MRLVLALVVVVVAACECGGPTMMVDDAAVPAPTDAGRRDAGRPIFIPPDGGTGPTVLYPGEECPPEVYDHPELKDLPDGSVLAGLCVGVRRFEVIPLLNSQPAPSALLRFVSDTPQEYEAAPVGGVIPVEVLRGLFDTLQYGPRGVEPSHSGLVGYPADPVNKLLDATSDVRGIVVNAKVHTLRGQALFGGAPFRPGATPDIVLESYGEPMVQTVRQRSEAGAYETRYLEGQFNLILNTPPEALFGTELIDYLVTPRLSLTQDSEQDIDIPTSVVEGSLSIDGKPFPDRLMGLPDFAFEYTVGGATDPAVRTYHEGGTLDFSASVPKGRYGVTLNLRQAPDRVYASSTSGVVVASDVDLTRDQRFEVALRTHEVEGALLIDGLPPRSNPFDTWTLYMNGRQVGSVPGVSQRFDIPRESAFFVVRPLEGTYSSVIVQLDDRMADDLIDGWYVARGFTGAPDLDVRGPTDLSINIPTTTLRGNLRIDGKAPPEGKFAGTLMFQNVTRDQGQWSFGYRRVLAGPDGRFSVRLPAAEYRIWFVIDRETYPEYAQGFTQIWPRLDLREPRDNIPFEYNTVLVTGPLRIGGRAVDDVTGGPELRMRFQPNSRLGWRTYTYDIHGGSPNYRLRIPASGIGYRMFLSVLPFGRPQTAWAPPTGAGSGGVNLGRVLCFFSQPGVIPLQLNTWCPGAPEDVEDD